MRDKKQIQIRIDELKTYCDNLPPSHPEKKRALVEIAALEWALGGSGIIGAVLDKTLY